VKGGTSESQESNRRRKKREHGTRGGKACTLKMRRGVIAGEKNGNAVKKLVKRREKGEELCYMRMKFPPEDEKGRGSEKKLSFLSSQRPGAKKDGSLL